MKKNIFMIVLIFIITIGILPSILYTNIDDTVNSTIYAYNTYNINIDGYEKVNDVINDNTLYILYKSNSNYLIKEIDITTNKETAYTYNTTDTCKLENNSNNIYITCKGNNTIKLYNSDFSEILKSTNTSYYDYAINVNSTYSIYQSNNTDYPEVLDSICNSTTCLLIRYNSINNLYSIYENDIILEEYITNYSKYEKGIYTYSNNLINVYNINNTYDTYYIDYIKIESIITISKSNYLYVLDNEKIEVFNLLDNTCIESINISNINDDVISISVNSNYLYVFTKDNVYVYNILDIENSNVYVYDTNSLEYLENMYNVNIYLDSINISNEYNIQGISGILNSEYMDELKNYLNIFGSSFFNTFDNEFNIYIVSSIDVLKDGYEDTQVIGLYYYNSSGYNIVVEASSLYSALVHETMHAIDDYLGDVFVLWDSLNPDGFEYSHVYYVNGIFTDTIGANYSDVYFIDNYARSSCLEDRARILEAICTDTDLSMYPNLEKKVEYLKEVLNTYFIINY